MCKNSVKQVDFVEMNACHTKLYSLLYSSNSSHSGKVTLYNHKCFEVCFELHRALPLIFCILVS